MSTILPPPPRPAPPRPMAQLLQRLASSIRQSSSNRPKADPKARVWRHEIKYVVPSYVRGALTADLRGFMKPDAYAGTDGCYVVRSLYLDSADFVCVFDKEAGQLQRHKLRLRSYPSASGPGDAVKFEIKHRYGAKVSKDVASVTVSAYRHLLDDLTARRMPDARWLREFPALTAFFRLVRLYGMAPRSMVTYRRQALVAAGDPSIRITFDDRLAAGRPGDLLAPALPGRALMCPSFSVLELKLGSRMPYWLHKLAVKYHLENVPVSKYFRGAMVSAYGFEGIDW